jgi:hypothetical protein
VSWRRVIVLVVDRRLPADPDLDADAALPHGFGRAGADRQHRQRRPVTGKPDAGWVPDHAERERPVCGPLLARDRQQPVHRHCHGGPDSGIGSLTSFVFGRMRLRFNWLVSNAAPMTDVVPGDPFSRVMRKYGLPATCGL